MTTNNLKLTNAELLFDCAAQMGLEPAWLGRSSRLFAVTTPLGERYVNGSRSTVNTQLSYTFASNKFYTRLILERNNLPGIPYLKTSDQAVAEQFLATHSKIIVKPVIGSDSHDVHIVESPEQMAGMKLGQYLLEKYIAGREFRYLVLNGQVIAVHESQYGESVSETRDLARISCPASAWDPELMTLALKTAATMGLRFCAVDYLINAQGEAHILEVNSSPGMKWFHNPTSGPKVDLARLFLEAMLSELDTEPPLATGPLPALSTVAYS